MKNRLLLAGILALGAGLRVWGVGFGLYHADEPIVVNHALAYGIGDFNPHFFAIPPLTSYCVFFVYVFFYALGWALRFIPNIASFQQLFVRDPFVFYVLARFFLGVVPGVATVALLYRLGDFLFGRPAGLGAALFLATNFLHVRDSHYIYADIPMTLSVLAAVYGSFLVYKKGGLGAYLWAGLWTGLAAAFKYNASLVGVTLVLAHFLGNGRKGHARLAAGLCLAATTYLISNPYTVLDFGAFASAMATQAKAEGCVGALHHLRYSLAGSAGWSFLLLSGIGLVKMFREDPRAAFILYSFPVLFYAELVVFSQYHERYALPLLPFLCLAATSGWLSLCVKGSRPWARFAALALVAVTLVFSICKSAYADVLFTRLDTRELARQWVERHLPPGSKIAFDHSFFRPDLLRSGRQWRDLSPEASARRGGSAELAKAFRDEMLQRYSDTSRPGYELFFLASDSAPGFRMARPRIPYDRDELDRLGMKYLVVHYGTGPEHESFYRSVLRKAKRLVRISPYRDPTKTYSLDPYSTTCAAYLWKELFSRERFGPVLEIYEID